MIDLQERILRFLADRPGATFIALCQGVEGMAGERFLAAPKCPGTLLWDAVSREGVMALKRLHHEGKIRFDVTSAEEYRAQGRVLPLPQQAALQRAQERCWVPVTVSLTESVSSSGARLRGLG